VSADGGGLPARLAAWAAAALGGPFTVEADCRHEHGLSGVWRLRAAAVGETVFLKAATKQVKWEQECHAYARWVGPAFGDRAPRLLAASERDPTVILLSALPGVCMEALDLTAAQKRDAWREAGTYLARLHGLERGAWFGGARPDGSPTGEKWADAAEWVRTRIEAAAAKGLAAGSLRPDEAEFARAAAPDWTAALKTAEPVPAHRDYSPRNWIASPETGRWVGVIDFEHAGWNVRAMDLCRPWSREFAAQPDLADAFFDGYRGGLPDAGLAAQIRAMRLWHCVASIVWAAEFGDARFVDESRAGLEALKKSAGGEGAWAVR
jgi:Ser/Thr protein kinase RdoA (MazF antagonist)